MKNISLILETNDNRFVVLVFNNEEMHILGKFGCRTFSVNTKITLISRYIKSKHKINIGDVKLTELIHKYARIFYTEGLGYQ